MKKLLLTAIAVIGFSVSGMASNAYLDLYKLEINDTSISSFEEDIRCRDCYYEADHLANFVENYFGLDGYHFFNAAYSDCVNSGQCCNCLDEVVITP